MIRRTLLSILLSACVASPVSAQGRPATRRPILRPTGPFIHVYGTYAGNALAATDTFEAVAGTSSAAGFGGGLVAGNLWKGLFVDAAFNRFSLEGERVFIDEGTVYKLGIPLTVTMTPIDVAAGWRFFNGRISPYIGAGMSSVGYKETSDFSQPGESVNERKTGLLALAGLDFRVTRWVQVGGEMRYRGVKAVLGDGGVSQHFGEDEIGGLSAAVRVSIGR